MHVWCQEVEQQRTGLGTWLHYPISKWSHYLSSMVRSSQASTWSPLSRRTPESSRTASPLGTFWQRWLKTSARGTSAFTELPWGEVVISIKGRSHSKYASIRTVRICIYIIYIYIHTHLHKRWGEVVALLPFITHLVTGHIQVLWVWARDRPLSRASKWKSSTVNAWAQLVALICGITLLSLFGAFYMVPPINRILKWPLIIPCYSFLDTRHFGWSPLSCCAILPQAVSQTQVNPVRKVLLKSNNYLLNWEA